jgi:hypothetical protein
VPKFELYKHNDELFNGHLKKFPFFSNGGHLGYRTALTYTNLKGDKKGGMKFKKIFSETTEPISTKLC